MASVQDIFNDLARAAQVAAQAQSGGTIPPGFVLVAQVDLDNIDAQVQALISGLAPSAQNIPVAPPAPVFAPAPAPAPAAPASVQTAQQFAPAQATAQFAGFAVAPAAVPPAQGQPSFSAAALLG
jgi:hypothetical protein